MILSWMLKMLYVYIYALHQNIYNNVHLSFFLFLSFVFPLDFDESSVFLERISRIKSQKTCTKLKHEYIINQNCYLSLPCRHTLQSLLMSQHTEHHPIAVLALDILITVLCVCRSNHICCQQEEMEYYRRFLLARSGRCLKYLIRFLDSQINSNEKNYRNS